MAKYVRLKPGARVIRGPDWQSRNLDGGEGHVGTIVYVPKKGSSSDKVTVIWDCGRELRFRAGEDGKYDLCLLDNSPTGVKHPNITCDECNENPLIGSRWKCSTCNDFDLCTTCYMSGKHDISHSFMRMDYEKATAYGVPPRKNSTPKPVYGIFKGATVMRGPHWKWKNDDGGGDEEGKVMAVTNWKDDSPWGGVRIKWTATKKEAQYRVGGEGCVDVVYTEKGEGPIKYYFDHLSVVDVINSGDIVLKRSDKVRVNLEEKEFRRMQENAAYGGWDDGMNQCLKELGTIVDMFFRGETIQLQYEDAKKWPVNRRCLTRVHSFSVGEAVTILGDVNSVKDLQEGHGGWNSEMNSSLGKTGRIVRIPHDGDLRVKIEERTWIYSPVCCLPVADVSQARNVPQLSRSEMDNGNRLDDLEMMKKDMDKIAGAVADLFVGLLRAMPDSDDDETSLVEACVKGDLDTVRSIIDKSPEKVNAKHEHKTGLQMACYEGHVEIVQYLLSKNADVHLTDEENDTALHFAAFGEEEQPMALLLTKGAKTDMRNKNGLTPLHVTVGKGSPACTKLLISHGASVNIKDNDGETPMHDCIIQKKDQSLLIEEVFNAKGADFSVQNDRSFNILHWAALKNCKKAADIVIVGRSDLVDSRMDEGFTALHICAANDHTEIASSLLEAKANTNAVDKNKRTPLHVAVTQSHKRVIELFLAAGCNVNAQDEKGNTPLHVAQMRRALPDVLAHLLGVKEEVDDVAIQISCLLLEAKADIDIQNKDEKSPLDLCTDIATREFIKRLAGQVNRKSFQSSMKGHMLPTHWDHMGSETIMRVHLDTSDGRLNKEYQGVQSNFMKTLPQARIFKIERVQNKYMWEHYFLKRKQFEAIYGKTDTNEMELYHGTYPDLVDIICENNLDCRLAGTNTGKMYGQGSYFAKNAKYSDGFSRADKDGFKYMLQCRVLAGRWALGNPNYKRPPQIDRSTKLYDCCVDNLANPEIFCLFDSNQYYPEYVIQYQ